MNIKDELANDDSTDYQRLPLTMSSRRSEMQPTAPTIREKI